MVARRDDDEDDIFAERRKDAAREAKEKAERGLFKLPVGETWVRILRTPRDEDAGSPALFMEYFIHRNVGPKAQLKPCGKRIEDESGKCWLCDVQIPKLEEEGKDAKAEAV